MNPKRTRVLSSRCRSVPFAEPEGNEAHMRVELVFFTGKSSLLRIGSSASNFSFDFVSAKLKTMKEPTWDCLEESQPSSFA